MRQGSRWLQASKACPRSLTMPRDSLPCSHRPANKLKRNTSLVARDLSDAMCPFADPTERRIPVVVVLISRGKSNRSPACTDQKSKASHMSHHIACQIPKYDQLNNEPIEIQLHTTFGDPTHAFFFRLHDNCHDPVMTPNPAMYNNLGYKKA